MIESANLIIFVINLISVILGGIAVGLVYSLTRGNNISYLNQFFFFLICAVITGFFDWVIYNWILLLVPEILGSTIDFIYHIFWDLIGFPALLFAFFFLVKSINGMLKIEIPRIFYSIFIMVLLLLIILGDVAFYLKIQELSGVLKTPMWIIYTYIIPLGVLLYLIFAYLYAIRIQTSGSWVKRFIQILFICLLTWNIFSLVPMQIGVWRYLIILSFYLALFLPSLFLYFKHKDLNIKSDIKAEFSLEKIFQVYFFTEREKEVTLLIMHGKTNKEISEELFVSLQTVKNYVSNIYKKIDINNRVQFVNFIRNSK